MLYLKRISVPGKLWILAVALVLSQSVCARAADQVKIASGEIQGITEPHSDIRAFLGIPFAAPPVGNLRWRAPQPV